MSTKSRILSEEKEESTPNSVMPYDNFKGTYQMGKYIVEAKTVYATITCNLGEGGVCVCVCVYIIKVLKG